jgi:hypothetical protein
MDALKKSDPASEVKENPTENKKVIQEIAPQVILGKLFQLRRSPKD